MKKLMDGKELIFRILHYNFLNKEEQEETEITIRYLKEKQLVIEEGELTLINK